MNEFLRYLESLIDATVVYILKKATSLPSFHALTDFYDLQRYDRAYPNHEMRSNVTAGSDRFSDANDLSSGQR